MSADVLFDATPYLRAPKQDVPATVALAVALLAAVPKKAPPRVIKEAKRLRKAVTRLQFAWSQRQRALVSDSADLRPFDNRLDTAWGALKQRLDAFATLPEDTTADAARAASIVRAIFGDGLAFLKLPFPAEWAESGERLARIDSDGHAKSIDELAGPLFLEEVRVAHASFGDALGITRPIGAAAEMATVREPYMDVLRAIGDYGLQIAALVDRDDPSTVEMARAALQPIDATREGMARRAGSVAIVDETEPNGVPADPAPVEPPAPLVS
jgi:hypothetical protein